MKNPKSQSNAQKPLKAIYWGKKAISSVCWLKKVYIEFLRETATSVVVCVYWRITVEKANLKKASPKRQLPFWLAGLPFWFFLFGRNCLFGFSYLAGIAFFQNLPFGFAAEYSHEISRG